MSRGLADGWVKLALIQRSLYRRKNTEALKRSLYRFLGSLLQMGWVDRKSPEVWQKLLDNHPQKWLKILHQYNIDPEHDDNPDTDDDPVRLTDNFQIEINYAYITQQVVGTNEFFLIDVVDFNLFDNFLETVKKDAELAGFFLRPS